MLKDKVCKALPFMKLLLKIKLLLLVACILADVALPLFVNKQDTQAMETCLETDQEKEEGLGEEKAGTDKLVGKVGLSNDFETSSLIQQFFDHDKLAKQFYSLPIPTPPPKSVG